MSHEYCCRISSYQQVDERCRSALVLAYAAPCVVRTTSSRKRTLKRYTTLLLYSSSIKKSPRLLLADTIVFKTVSCRKSSTTLRGGFQPLESHETVLTLGRKRQRCAQNSLRKWLLPRWRKHYFSNSSSNSSSNNSRDRGRLLQH